MFRKSRICWVLVLVFSIDSTVARADRATTKKNFDMPMSEYQRLSESEQRAAIESLSPPMPALSPEELSRVSLCMKALANSPTWQTQKMSLLLQKCSLEMGVAKTDAEAHMNATVACIKKEVPDFSANEYLALSFSILANTLADAAHQQLPANSPRMQRIEDALKRCEPK
jgi:hypothetical protein